LQLQKECPYARASRDDFIGGTVVSWFRLDDQGAFHAKVLLAGNEAYGAWCRAGQWASAQRTDGIVPEQVAKQIAPNRIWQRLIEAGLIEPRAASTDPYVIHDFLEYNPSRSELDDRRSSRASAGKVGGIRSGEVRRGKQDASIVLPEIEADAKQGAIENRTPIPSRPDPVPSRPKEEPEEDSLTLASEQSPVAPSTSRSPSPATMSPAQEASFTPTLTKQRKPRATKPKLSPLTVEALTPDERAVHDVIVQDVTLVQICSEVPQLARDLVAIATDQSDRIAINVIAEVRKAAGWNRDNAGTVKAWTTKGGNRGLRSWIERAMARSPIPYPSTRPSGNVAPANATPVPPPPAIVDLAKHPELAPRPMRSARF
jgi:hypothetical protein